MNANKIINELKEYVHLGVDVDISTVPEIINKIKTMQNKIDELEKDRLEFANLLNSDLFYIQTRGEELVSINCIECGVSVQYSHKDSCSVSNTVTKAVQIAKGIK